MIDKFDERIFKFTNEDVGKTFYIRLFPNIDDVSSSIIKKEIYIDNREACKYSKIDNFSFAEVNGKFCILQFNNHLSQIIREDYDVLFNLKKKYGIVVRPEGRVLNHVTYYSLGNAELVKDDKFKIDERYKFFIESGYRDITKCQSLNSIVDLKVNDMRQCGLKNGWLFYNKSKDIWSTYRIPEPLIKRKFKLLKDSPGVRAGAIYEQTESGIGVDYKCITPEYYKFDSIKRAFFDCGTVENNPEWLVEIFDDEKEKMGINISINIEIK